MKFQVDSQRLAQGFVRPREGGEIVFHGRRALSMHPHARVDADEGDGTASHEIRGQVQLGLQRGIQNNLQKRKAGSSGLC